MIRGSDRKIMISKIDVFRPFVCIFYFLYFIFDFGITSYDYQR